MLSVPIVGIDISSMALGKESITVIWTKSGRLQGGSKRTSKIRRVGRRKEGITGRRKGNTKKIILLYYQ